MTTLLQLGVCLLFYLLKLKVRSARAAGLLVAKIHFYFPSLLFVLPLLVCFFKV